MRSKINLLFLISFFAFCQATDKENYFSAIEEKLEFKFSEYTNYIVKWLESFNDEHLGNSELGRFLHYNEIKPKVEETAREGRKKMSMAMMPLIFHLGATSTWMLLTTIMAAKSVAIGLLLLVFKIAVSSAKLASFFTVLKAKHHHHDWSWSPHDHHHGHSRSFTGIEHPVHEIPVHHETHDSHPPPAWHSYSPEWTPDSSGPDYKTISNYKHSDHDVTAYDDLKYAGTDAKKKIDKKFG